MTLKSILAAKNAPTSLGLGEMPLYGLLLVGGKSKRMGTDKSHLEYHGKAQWKQGLELLSRVCSKVFLSVRAKEGWGESGQTLLVDQYEDIGPLGGILTALTEFKESSWLVLACDLPFVNEGTLRLLLEKRNPLKVATAFKSNFDGLPEPLCAIYEPQSRERLELFLKEGHRCPRKALIHSDIELLSPVSDRSLDNVNTQEERKEVLKSLNPSPVFPSACGGAITVGTASSLRVEDSPPLAPGNFNHQKKIRIDYYALLREERGTDHEEVSTPAVTAQALYEELQSIHRFSLTLPSLRVAVNDTFCDWSQELQEGDHVVFIPPVSGGA